MRLWMDVMRDLESVMADHERIFDAWAEGGVDDDIWFSKDLNQDGDLLDAGEGLARWASNGTLGSEFTGLWSAPRLLGQGTGSAALASSDLVATAVWKNGSSVFASRWAAGSFGKVTFSTPLSNCASTLGPSTSAGSVKRRSNMP